MAELADRVAALGRSLFGYQGKVVRQRAEADYLVDNPKRRCPVIAKAREQTRLRAARSRSTKACGAR